MEDVTNQTRNYPFDRRARQHYDSSICTHCSINFGTRAGEGFECSLASPLGLCTDRTLPVDAAPPVLKEEFGNFCVCYRRAVSWLDLTATNLVWNIRTV